MVKLPDPSKRNFNIDVLGVKPGTTVNKTITKSAAAKPAQQENTVSSNKNGQQWNKPSGTPQARPSNSPDFVESAGDRTQVVPKASPMKFGPRPSSMPRPY